jgi:hypothetical protein
MLETFVVWFVEGRWNGMFSIKKIQINNMNTLQ